MMSTARGSSGSSSSSNSNKQQRNVKGFVKRCRSFKEDIISRLARNRTGGADEISGGRTLSSHSGIASPSGWSSKSPTPGDESSVEPVTLISHRLKEVNLTLHFVESLIQKNCVELLGGSSNVMLDLMGCLFNDIKKMPSSDSPQFQSIISQLKTVLSDFLTAVDALLLKEGYDDAQRELYFEKVQESIATSRDALSGLRNLIGTRDSGSSSTLSITSSPFSPMKTGVLSQDFSSSGNISSSTPLAKANNNTLAPPLSSSTTTSLSSSTQSPIVNSSPTRFSETSGTKSNNVIVTPTPSTFNNCLASSTPIAEPEEKKPPLPPKSKQISRRSFDSDWPDSITPTSVSAGPSSPRRMSHQAAQNLSHSHQRFLTSQQQNINSSLVVAPAVSLDQWLEQSNVVSSSASVRVSINNIQATSSMNSMNSSNVLVTSASSTHHQQQQQSFHQLNSSSGGLLTTSSQVQQNNIQSGDSSLWINSAIYVSRSTHSTASDSKEQLKVCRNRTYSDSYQLDYEDNHLERLVSDYERRSVKSGTTHNSLSLSLGSSLDNLLLVDAQSQQSGLSPNSNTSGTGCTGAMHSLSGSSNHPSDATGRLTNFGDFEVDEDVFVTEVVDGCVNKPQPSLKYLPPNSRLNKQTPVEDDSDNEIPPVLPEKRRINKHFTIDHGYGVGESVYSTCCKHPHQPNARCYSPYDNVEDNDSILQLWHGGIAGGSTVSGYKAQQQQSFMTQSESRVTLVGTAGTDSEEKPPLPPKKKHSLIAAYVEFMHNFDLHSQRHQHFCNHYAARNHHLSEIISTSEDPQPPLPHPGFQRPYLSERSATMFNPSTGEIPGFTGITSPSSSTVAHTAFSNSHSGGGVNKAALYSASYHHFSTFSNSSIPSEENSPTHQHFPLTGSSSSTSRSLSDHASGNDNGGGSGSGNETRPPLPPKKSRSILKSLLGELSNNSSQETEKSASNNNHENGSPTKGATTPSSPAAGALPPKSIPSKPATPTSPNALTTVPAAEQSTIANNTNATSPTTNEGGSSTKSPQRSLDEDSIDLFMIDPTPLLVLNKKSSPPTSTSSSSNNQNQSNKTAANRSSVSDGPLEVKGAEPLVLLVYAASPDVVDTKFRETFLLTYRNFLRPTDVVSLLWKRFKHFENKTDRTSMIHARATLDVFVDVAIGLTPMDLDDEMVSRVRKCIYHLVCSGEIQSALKARKGIIHKYQVRLKILKPQPAPATLAVTTEWSATSIAQQMTLLDADLFRELEPAELLLWAREQVEDLCPALNNFTEHFNKVSYWTRTRVLMCSTSRERNRTMKKLIGVMRKLREYNNFNSLLAVLAALDSAPIRRLGFSRRLTEALKPHAALTDSSGSFRTYRQALADCSPPCIPYIGLVLQDLTFVHIGNPDFLTDGKVNWVKRLQQWVILEPIRRLHTCHYGFSRNDALLAFLNNFDEYLNDDDLWQLSESIKPQTKNN